MSNVEEFMDDLLEVRRTIGRMRDPDIITVNLYPVAGVPAIHIHVTDDVDADQVLNGAIGNGLIHVDQDWDEEYDRYSIRDTNGVEVFWLIKKAAAEAGTPEAAEENDSIEHSVNLAPIIGDDGQEVKEDSNAAVV